MTVVKRSISFDSELLARAHDEAQRRFDGNLSALIACALDKELRNASLRLLMEDYQAEHGTFSDEEMAIVDEELWG